MSLNPEHYRPLLRQRRAELAAELTAEQAAAHQPLDLDPSAVGSLSRMDALQSHAMALEAERRHEMEIQRIDHALERIEAGGFGLCIRCGEEIAAKRLDLDPAVPTCINCAGH